MDLSPVELVGYLASALIVASLAMTSVVRLRTVSLIGSIVFVVYGALIGSIPIIITNAAIAGLNIWFLRKEFSKNRDLGAVPIDPHSPFLQDFLSSHTDDIGSFHPSFKTVAADDFALVLTRDGLPAGALVGRKDGDTLHLHLDYVMAAYRDSRIGEWLYGRGASALLSKGIKKVVSADSSPAVRDYLLRVGFTEVGTDLIKQLRS